MTSSFSGRILDRRAVRRPERDGGALAGRRASGSHHQRDHDERRCGDRPGRDSVLHRCLLLQCVETGASRAGGTERIASRRDGAGVRFPGAAVRPDRYRALRDAARRAGRPSERRAVAGASRRAARFASARNAPRARWPGPSVDQERVVWRHALSDRLPARLSRRRDAARDRGRAEHRAGHRDHCSDLDHDHGAADTAAARRGRFTGGSHGDPVRHAPDRRRRGCRHDCGVDARRGRGEGQQRDPRRPGRRQARADREAPVAPRRFAGVHARPDRLRARRRTGIDADRPDLPDRFHLGPRRAGRNVRGAARGSGGRGEPQVGLSRGRLDGPEVCDRDPEVHAAERDRPDRPAPAGPAFTGGRAARPDPVRRRRPAPSTGSRARSTRST